MLPALAKSELVAWLAMLIEVIGSVLIGGYLLAAVVTLLRERSRGIRRARLLIASGVLWGLSFKVAAALLKTVIVTTWPQLGVFVVVLALRTLLKRVFTWEERQLRAMDAPAPTAPATE